MYDLQRHEKDPLETISRLSFTENRKPKIILDSWKLIIGEIENNIDTGKKACNKIWNSSDELLEIIGLPWMENLEDALPSRLKIEEVERLSEERDVEI